MTATAHAIVGGLIATQFPHAPFLAFGLSVVSHVIMDCIPHWDVGTNWEKRSKSQTGILAILETLFGLSFGTFLFWQHTPALTLFSGIVGAEILDWLEAPWFIFFGNQTNNVMGNHPSSLQKFFFSVYKIQEDWFHKRAQAPFGIITQIVTVGFFYLLLAK